MNIVNCANHIELINVNVVKFAGENPLASLQGFFKRHGNALACVIRLCDEEGLCQKPLQPLGAFGSKPVLTG